MVDGLAQVVGQPALTAVVNTGDDGDFYGLRVCPDLDICTYVLAGVVSERGWGYADDTFRCLEGLATYGEESWFGLGDRDLATHIHRTLRLAAGAPLSQVTAEICARLGVEARLLPMTDDPVRTRITTPGGVRTFQEYLVRTAPPRRSARSRWSASPRRRPAPGLLEAIAAAERIVIAPRARSSRSGPSSASPGCAPRWRPAARTCVAVSPIIGGAPGRGPGPTASSPAPATTSARRPRWPASTPTWRRPSCSTRATRARRPTIAALGRAPGADRRPDARPARPGAAGGDGARGARVSAAAHLGGHPGEAPARRPAAADPGARGAGRAARSQVGDAGATCSAPARARAAWRA